MTPRHWLLLAFIAVLLITGALLIVATSDRPAPNEEPVVEAGAE